MPIKIWNSYSCNNSSSFRLVARFDSPEAAEQMAGQLREFFDVHAKEIDERGDYDETPSEAQREVGKKYGFEWGESLYWGDDGLEGDQPDVFTHDNVLIVQHTYCGGLGDLNGFVKAAGATSASEEDSRTVDVSLLFTAPAGNASLDSELAELFGQIDNRKDKWGEIKAPWAEHDGYGNASYFRDGGTVGVYLPVDPRDLASLKSWLGERTTHQSLEIGERDDFAKFTAIKQAKCTSCSGGLDYLDPRIHDIETPQLVCKPCGGLYDVATFLPKP
jgi:hypothetical protein